MSGFKPIGFKRYECWSDALLLPKDSAAWGAASHMYRHCFDGVRIMSKFEEYDKRADLYMKNTLDKAKRARELGLEVMLCLDWHNKASSQASYHEYRYFPKDLRSSVTQILKDVHPDVVQVANEPYYVKKGKQLTLSQYAKYVDIYTDAMRSAGFTGLLVAEQSSGDYGDLHNAWEWHVDWDFCAEGKHRLPRVLHEHSTAYGVRMDLESNAWADRSQPKGYNFAIFQDEFSSCGRGIHVNSKEGASAMRVSMEFFKKKKVPVGWLTMGGGNPEFGGGSWGMHTDLVNSLGEVSLSGQELLRFLGKPQYDGGSEPPPPSGKIDMLEVMAPSSVDFAKTSSVGGMVSTIRDDENRIFAIVKGKPGKAWDWFYWDDEFIYHFLTTDGDKDDATAFKTHVEPGVIWCRRFATLGESHVSSPKYHRWANCTQAPAISLASARTTLHGKSYTAGGLGMASDDVPGNTTCYQLDWRWGPNIDNLETFTYAVGWGHLDWDLSGHDVKPFNQRSTKPLVQPDFPCFDVPYWVDENLRRDDSPPDDVPPGGWHTVRTPHAAYMKMNNEEVLASYEKIKAGGAYGNHMITRQCAVLPEDVPSVERQLKTIIDSWD